MTPRTLQDWVDLVLDASAQQWVLRALTVVMPVLSLVFAAAAIGRWWPAGLAVVGLLSIATALRPDTHFALGVVVVCTWHWAAIEVDVATGWLPAAASALLVFHAAVALAASLPTGSVVPTAVLMRWGGRVGVAAAVTVGMWAAASSLERRDLPGNAVLTGAAFAVVGLAALGIRARSLRSTGASPPH